MMLTELIEKTAITMAVGNNGGEWATHYTHEQKGFWRSRALNVVTDVATWLRAGTPQDDTMEVIGTIRPTGQKP